ARAEADRLLHRLGVGAVPLLREELRTPASLEQRRRLERLIADLTRLPWHDEPQAAVREARRTGKPLLGFSTLGAPGSFGCLGSTRMRTVPFAALDVVDPLRQHFVLLWHDQTYDLAAPPAAADAAPAGDYPEGGGGGNLRTFFCTPDGTVFRYLEG